MTNPGTLRKIRQIYGEEKGMAKDSNNIPVPISVNMSFGKEQERLIDKLITMFTASGQILDYHKTERDDMIHYIFTFRQAYDIYVFGHTQRGMDPFNL